MKAATVVSTPPSTNLYSRNNILLCDRWRPVSTASSLHSRCGTRPARCFSKERSSQNVAKQGAPPFLKYALCSPLSKKLLITIPRCSSSSDLSDKDQTSDQEKIPFGYTRKDVLLIGLGLTGVGVGLKSGLEYFGVDPLQAGNVVQLVLVLGLTIGWISTYIFRVSNKEMTYAQQLRDYEDKVLEKRLESLTEAEIEALLEQVEEEKLRLANGERINN